MRITNRILTNNALRNISVNKKHLDFFGNQYATEQKIQRPSDDPTIAVRDLKYTSQLLHIQQYVDKNIKDATNWMDLTESSMSNINGSAGSTGIYEKIHSYCVEGSNGTWELEDRDKIVEALNEYKEQILDEINTDYGGRYLFAGYRTDTPITLDKKALDKLNSESAIYSIKEQASFTDIDIKSYVSGGAVYTAGNTADDYAGKPAKQETAKVWQLGYRGIDASGADGTGAGARATGVKSFSITKADGTVASATPGGGAGGYKLVEKSISATPQGSCYNAAADEVVWIPETGEIVFGANAYLDAQSAKDISVEYTKSADSFKEKDLNPIHFYDCEKSYKDTSGTAQTISYKKPEAQNIQYEISFSQKLTINTLAVDCLDTDVLTKIDELIEVVNNAYAVKDRISETDKMIQALNTSASDYQTQFDALTELKKQLEAELTLKEKVLQDTCSSGLTVVTEAQAYMSKAEANAGSRYNRLELTAERMASTEVDVTELKTKNINIDLEEAIINYGSANITYNASLSCASKVLKQSLLDYL